MGLRITQVDAFTDTPFSGNPAAVCILPEPRADSWMQNVASEMNLSETAFLVRQEDGFSLRWFTPVAEVDLCGHATLASAHVLWQEGHLAENEQARFTTRSGLLTAGRSGEWIELNFPVTRPQPASAPPGLEQALGINATYVGKSRFDYLLEVDGEDVVRSIQPDFTLLKAVPTRGVMVTGRASMPGYDFVSRFFAPRMGVNEDPVTGSAHCCLTPYWTEKLGKNELIAYQASARGGTLHVRIVADRVYLKGQAVTVLRGELLS